MSNLFFRESPVTMGENSSKAWNLKVSAFDGSAIALSGTITTVAYKEGSGNDVSGSITTGTATVEGNTLSTETFSGLSPNNMYIIAWYCKINEVQDLVGKLKIIVESDKSE
jgi:hypothetical protein